MVLLVGSRPSVEIALKYAIPTQDHIIRFSICFRLIAIYFLQVASVDISPTMRFL